MTVILYKIIVCNSMLKGLFIIIILSIQLSTGQLDHRVVTTLKYSKFYVKPTIVNGSPASEGDLPYLVSIKVPNSDIDGEKLWSNLCGGSIISPNRVLSAAHCFEQNNFFHHKHFYRLRVVAGDLRTKISHSGQSLTTGGPQWRELSAVKLHHDFNFPMHDIALVYLTISWMQSGNVNFIELARSPKDYHDNCVSAGYGKLGHNKIDQVSTFLRIASLHLLTRNQCSRIWEVNMDSFICTDSLNADVGVGDSGGPLTCKLSSRKSQGNLLVGVVSAKNFDKTTIFTRVSAYVQWIDSDVGNDLRPRIFPHLFLVAFILF